MQDEYLDQGGKIYELLVRIVMAFAANWRTPGPSFRMQSTFIIAIRYSLSAASYSRNFREIATSMFP